ncbi:MAG: ABC transporter substrate-binding protein [Chloroflexota bacterium]|nr:ABC transporter substrate-binding protein [Chloroflexota bacterium]
MLAKSFQLAPDMSRVTIQLQQGVQFHKGYGEMTAEDVVWSLNDANGKVTPTSIHPQAGDLGAKFGPAKVLGKYEMEIPFTAYDVSWNANRSNTAGLAWGVVSKAAYDKNGEEWSRNNIIGTGSYQVLEWLAANRAVLEAVPNHWRKTAKAPTLRFVSVPEASTRLAMLRTGEADVIPTVFKDLKATLDEGFKTVGAGGGVKASFIFSGNYWEKVDPRTGQPLPVIGVTYDPNLPWMVPLVSVGDEKKMERARKVRWAMSMAIDRELINKTVLNGLGWAEYEHFVSVKQPQWQAKWAVPYDPAGAEKLLDEAGYPKKDGVRFDVSIFIQVPAVPAEIADAVGGFLDKVGIRTTVDKSAYAIGRPSMVGRTWTKPFIRYASEAVPQRPFDWPKGDEMSFLGRGGFGPGIEIPKITETLLAVGKEPDIQKRIRMNVELVDYVNYWMITSAIVTWPTSLTYNPKSIASWPMKTYFPTLDMAYPEYMVPAR